MSTRSWKPSAEFGLSGRTPMIVGGEPYRTSPPSIFKGPNSPQSMPIRMPDHNASFPDTKATTRRTVHNIGKKPVSERPGKEMYDPVQPGGKSMLDHYPYSACTIKEVNVDQSGTAQLVGSGSRLG